MTGPVRVVSPRYGLAIGPGPVYPVTGASTATLDFVPPRPDSAYPAGFGGMKVLWVIDPAYEGPVLIRGRRLDGPGTLWFQLGGDQSALPEMQLQPATSPAWRDWPSATLLTKAGCYAWQVDGTSFSITIVFRAVLVPITANGA
jgi:hypothetical protein